MKQKDCGMHSGRKKIAVRAAVSNWAKDPKIPFVPHVWINSISTIPVKKDNFIFGNF